MKKIIYITSLFGVIFCIITWKSFFDMYYFYVGKNKIENAQYIESIPYFTKLSDSAISFYNIGNAFFYHGRELEGDVQNKAYVQALSMYEASLEEREDADTRKNYEYVQSLLEPSQDTEEKTQEHPPEENPSEESSPEEETQNTDTEEQSETSEPSEDTSQENNQEQESPSESNGSETSSDTQTQESQSGKNPERGEQYQLEDSDTTQKLSQGELEALERHIQNLEYEQFQNQRFFGKKEQSEQGDMFDQFFQNPFFRQDLYSTEKDW